MNRQTGSSTGPRGTSVGKTIAMYSYLLLPFVATIYALSDAVLNGVHFLFPLLALTFYKLDSYGVTVGLHRYFTHQSFTTSKFWQYFLGIHGLKAFQATSIAIWGGDHDNHHRWSDQPGRDPHTPYEYGRDTLRNKVSGFWHAHFAWLLRDRPQATLNDTYSKLRGNHVVARLDRWAWVWISVGFALPTLVGYLFTRTPEGVWQSFLWGGAVRLFFLQHFTWSVNSVCHLWGRRRFKTRDWSRNNPFVTLVTNGEGTHNDHHVAPRSPCHNLLSPWLDESFWIIRLIGSDYNKNIPPQETIEMKRID